MSAETDELDFEEDLQNASNLGEQALWVFIHIVVAFGAWAAMMLAITLTKPETVPVLVTTALSFVVPGVVGNIFTRIKQNDMAPYTWLIGMIWFLVVCLWVLDMPTGPNQCYHCDASSKIYLTFFSPNEESGLIDNEGRLFGTWPAVAFIGYGIGSGFGLKKKK